MKLLSIADLFCGAGGTSTGAMEAARACGYRPQLTAVNHWPVAVATHTLNHPEARHFCTGVDELNPRALFSEGELDILWASPECTHHSIARGGRPVNDQSRSTAWCVTKWAEQVRPRMIFVENVPEFLSWGPLVKRLVKGKFQWVPDPKRKGAVFKAWVATLEALGYRVEWRILCAADFGDPTTRKRLFVQAVSGRLKVVWPEPTHSATGADGKKKWVGAREIIDWSLPSTSIFSRKKPLSEKTMRRIWAGLKKYGIRDMVVPWDHQGSGESGARTTDDPIGTQTTKARHGLLQPFIVSVANTQSTGRGPGVWSACEPLRTVTTTGAFGMCEPMIIELRGTNHKQVEESACPVDRPISAVATSGAHHALLEPFIVPHFGERGGQSPRTHSVDKPLPTVTGQGAGSVVLPFLVQVAHGNGAEVDGDSRRARSLDVPLPTVCGSRGEMALCEPSLLPQQSDGRLRAVSEPVPTVATAGAIGLVEPYLIEYYGNGGAQAVTSPVPTCTTKPRFGLVLPEVVVDGKRYLLDLRFRMLQPKELAGAQGFKGEYRFSGTKTDVVKQIGNAVPRRLARALVTAALKQHGEVVYED